MEFIYMILSFLITFFISVIIGDNNNIQKKRYCIHTSKVKKDVNFVFLTDLHGHEFDKDNAKLVKKIDEINPDFVLIGGDLITAKFSFSVDPMMKLVSALSNKYKVYYCIGNHEARLQWSEGKYAEGYQSLLNIIRESGATILDNESILLEEYGINIHGLNLGEKYYLKKRKVDLPLEHINELVKINKDEGYNILMAHDPEYFDSYSGTDADLVLSGHMHGGVMRLPYGYGAMDPRFHLFGKYSWGTFVKNKTRLIVSAGLAMHTIMIRVFNPAELTIINIKKK